MWQWLNDGSSIACSIVDRHRVSTAGGEMRGVCTIKCVLTAAMDNTRLWWPQCAASDTPNQTHTYYTHGERSWIMDQSILIFAGIHLKLQLHIQLVVSTPNCLCPEAENHRDRDRPYRRLSVQLPAISLYHCCAFVWIIPSSNLQGWEMKPFRNDENFCPLL